MENMLYAVGPTAGGVTLTVRPRTKTLTDEFGVEIRRLCDGCRIEIKGKLARLSRRAAALLIGGANDDGANAATLGNATGRSRLLLVCPLTEDANGEKLRISLLASPAGGTLAFAPDHDGISFTLEAESDADGVAGRMAFA